jgi:hypothetical protein
LARSRNIKPGFFLNDILADIEPLGRLLFIGLWTLADREGRLEDRPKKIKAAVLPYDNCNVDKLLQALHSEGFITRYTVGGNRYIQVLNFCKHQHPHVKEPASEIPAPDKSGTSIVQESDLPAAKTSDSLLLIPDSLLLIPDSLLLIPDSLLLIPDSLNPLIDSLIPSPDGSEGIPKMSKEEMFNQFWAAYPKRKNKGTAEKAWAKIKPDELLLRLILNKLDDASVSYEWTKEGGQYIPYPASWLNAKGWEDEYAQIENVPDAWHEIRKFGREEE